MKQNKIVLVLSIIVLANIYALEPDENDLFLEAGNDYIKLKDAQNKERNEFNEAMKKAQTDEIDKSDSNR